MEPPYFTKARRAGNVVVGGQSDQELAACLDMTADHGIRATEVRP